jgi:hypothetical protein
VGEAIQDGKAGQGMMDIDSLVNATRSFLRVSAAGSRPGRLSVVRRYAVKLNAEQES